MASALRGLPGGSTPPMAYAPYDVLLVVVLPLLPPPVVARLWLSPYDDLPVTAPVPVVYALVTVPCGVPPMVT